MTAIGVQTYRPQKYSGVTKYFDGTAASLAAPSRKRPASVVVPREQEPMQSEPQPTSPPTAGGISIAGATAGIFTTCVVRYSESSCDQI